MTGGTAAGVSGVSRPAALFWSWRASMKGSGARENARMGRLFWRAAALLLLSSVNWQVTVLTGDGCWFNLYGDKSGSTQNCQLKLIHLVQTHWVISENVFRAKQKLHKKKKNHIANVGIRVGECRAEVCGWKSLTHSRKIKKAKGILQAIPGRFDLQVTTEW